MAPHVSPAIVELFLNLVWLVIAAGAAAALVLARERRWIAITATICLVVLLFPIISITDDLASDPAVVEETTAVRRGTHIGNIDALHVIAIVIVVTAFVPALRSSSFVFASIAPRLHDGHVRVLPLRGPPVRRS